MFIFAGAAESCKKEKKAEPVVPTPAEPSKGCKIPQDDNYDPSAEVSDSSLCDPTGTVAKFVGTYTGCESCNSGTSCYMDLIIQPGNAPYTIRILNFYGFGTNFVAQATVSQKYIAIPSQTFAGFTMQGNGFIQNNILNLTYQISSNDTSDICNFQGIITN